MFLSPLFLLAAGLGAAIPLMLHLMQNRRKVELPIPTLRFLKLAEKHGTKTATGMRVTSTFGVKDIAEMAATTVERVERILEKLEDDGLTHIADGDLVIPDLSALKRALDYMGSS